MNENYKENFKRVITTSSTKDEVRSSKTRVTLNDQKLMDLWNNELSGQFSDGVWENSTKTDWLWRSTSVVLGTENKIEIDSESSAGRKTFNIYNQLDVVRDRMRIESGFETNEELKAACKVIQNMIANPVVDEKIRSEVRGYEVEQETKARNILKSVIESLKI